MAEFTLSPEKQKLYDERLARVETAFAGGTPDRVPFVPRLSGFYNRAYGIQNYAVMNDLRNFEPGIRQFLRDFEPDFAWSVMVYKLSLIEALGASYIKVPGPISGLDLDAPFQFIDDVYMQDDEFDEFLLDPTHFILTKVLPRKNKNLSGLAKLNFEDLYEHIFNMNLAKLCDPEVKQTIETMIRAGEQAAKYQQESAHIARIFKEEGFPLRGGAMYAPFDVYADSLRGFMEATMDLYEYPDECLACVNRIAEMTSERSVKAAAARGDKTIYMPLHAGTDNFMSQEQYEKFYWPTLEQIINLLIEHGITPYLFFEGAYNDRLDFLAERLPAHKCVCLFETVDMKRAKETVGQIACICGNLSTQLLAFGTKQQVIDETKRLLDICAPGGGYIMDCSLIIENANFENVMAWRETTLEYGKY